MKLRDKQSIFAKLISCLIIDAYSLGYEITLGEAYRSPEEAQRLANLGLGIKNSLHTMRLAVDINLFKNGVYLTKTEDYEVLGLLWESWSGPDFKCRWGGRFKRRDGNHFSIEHLGIK